MNPKYYHTPPKPVSTRARCPVCHESVYSRAGIHPQCAVRQSDPPRPRTKPADGVATPVAVAEIPVLVDAAIAPPVAVAALLA